jgi:hypothetical protein
MRLYLKQLPVMSCFFSEYSSSVTAKTGNGATASTPNPITTIAWLESGLCDGAVVIR